MTRSELAHLRYLLEDAYNTVGFYMDETSGLEEDEQVPEVAGALVEHFLKIDEFRATNPEFSPQ